MYVFQKVLVAKKMLSQFDWISSAFFSVAQIDKNLRQQQLFNKTHNFEYNRYSKSRSFRGTSPTVSSTSRSSSASSSGSNNINLWRKPDTTVTTSANSSPVRLESILKIPPAQIRKEPSRNSIRHHRHSQSGSSTDTGSSRENESTRRYNREEVRDESEMVISSYTKAEKPRHHHHHHHRHKHRPRE